MYFNLQWSKDYYGPTRFSNGNFRGKPRERLTTGRNNSATNVRSIHKCYQYLCSLSNSIFWVLLILPVFFMKYKTETSLIAGCNYFMSQQRGVKQIFVSTFSFFTLHFAINSLIFGRTRTSPVVVNGP